ncbi:(S)-benzoin forming benzil reductase [Xanthocytophaga flava]|uniref:(S)-benzoin forming benzil reductase n=1 Tax=Xanthocytophaga flava TaxID=3048013 RepID=UPI0028D154BB|nr:(S)-benzoin forming benzil reductase [Xanthocytophaga flavus]MDJ1473597.1 (S)-benzoin forming benzil reductase [Xanthocytophaga flavus]
MDNILLITGGSRGIGQALVTTYLQKGYKVFSIARSHSSEKHPLLHQISFDLSASHGFGTLFKNLFKEIEEAQTASILLINNAAALPIGKIDTLTQEHIQQATHVNLTAPLLLTSLFIQHTQGWKCDKKIINISSGAAHKPYYGWTIYCSTKAALDMLTRTVAIEQSTVENGVKILSISPGVVDTGMQSAIRESTREDFKDIDRFIELKNTNALAEPTDVANQIYQVALDTAIENGAILDLRKLSTTK